MTDHLPECLMNLEYAVRVCICTELRACEQRVRQTDWATDNAYWTGQTEGYTAALRDAKAAVMAVPRGGWGLKVHEHYRNCIAAIEALGGER